MYVHTLSTYNSTHRPTHRPTCTSCCWYASALDQPNDLVRASVPTDPRLESCSKPKSRWSCRGMQSASSSCSSSSSAAAAAADAAAALLLDAAVVAAVVVASLWDGWGRDSWCTDRLRQKRGGPTTRTLHHPFSPHNHHQQTKTDRSTSLTAGCGGAARSATRKWRAAAPGSCKASG